jgi:hypothetical protein
VFIDEALPNAHIGESRILLVGETSSPDAEKQALIRFELPEPPSLPNSFEIEEIVWEHVGEGGVGRAGKIEPPDISVRLNDCIGPPLAVARIV